MSSSDGHQRNEIRVAINRPDLPYPGLRAFRLNEWPIFFGRERMVDDVIDRIGASRFVMVHGASGSGKSSLIRAGVIAQLQREHANRGLDWCPATMMPGSSPMWHFATALVNALTGRDTPDHSETAKTRLRLNRGSDGVTEVLRELGFGSEQRLFMLVDQFEEIFRFADEGGTREAADFVRLLVDLHNRCPDNVYVALTMRSDHLGDCSRFAGLAEIVNATQYLVPPMDDAELEDAICRPAALYKGSADKALALRLIRDTRYSPDQLPLIQHALSYMWSLDQHRNPNQAPNLSLGCYNDRTGGSVTMALSNHADAILNELTKQNKEARNTTERVFRALTQIDNAGRAIRRRRSHKELLDEIGGSEEHLDLVIEAYAEKNLLVIEEADPERDPKIDISHEALIRHWATLSDEKLDESGQPRGWVAREANDGRIWQSLVATVESAKDSAEIYLPKVVYESRQAWRESRNPTAAWAEEHGNQFQKIEELFERSRKHIEEEKKAIEAAELEKEKFRQRELAHARELAEEHRERAEMEARSAGRFRRLSAALAVVSIVAVVSAVIAIYSYISQKRISSALEVTSNALKIARDQLQTSLEAEQDARAKLNQFLTYSIEQLKKDRDTMAIAKNWEDQLKGTIEIPPPPPMPLDEWLRKVATLRNFIEAHNEVLKKLGVGELLDDKATTKTVEEFIRLHDELEASGLFKPFFDETSSIGKDFEELKERIQTLDKIRSQSEPESLMEIAETAEHTEAIYAAWIRLGEFKERPWPSEKKDLDRDRTIRGRLKNRFEAIRRQDETHGNVLLQTLTRTGLQYESDFIEEKNIHHDKVLGEFCILAVMGIFRYTPGEFESLEDLARRLADFVNSPNWPDKFQMNPPTKGNPLYQKTNLTIKDFENWLLEAEDYRKLESDPRQQYRSDQTIKEFRENIEKLRPNLPDKAEEFQKKLVEDEKNIRELLLKPAIVKNEAYINHAVTELKDIGERLVSFQANVNSYIFPRWCANVSIVKDVPEGKYKVVLKSEQLRNKFVPLRTSNKRPMEVDEDSYAGLLPDDFVEEKYRLDNLLNDGWPKYISSPNDPNVIFRFIPAVADNTEPFYIATREITYAQYAFFLQKSGSKPVGYYRQSKFGAEGKAFISWTEIDKPPCPIEWKDQTFDVNNYIGSGDLPVTYVTYDGAQAYADWLGGQLPDAKQHRYACRAGTTSKYPWGENISDILEYAHVRANPWQQAAEKYNDDKDHLRAQAILPIGAVKSDKDYMNEPDPLKKKGLILNRIVAKGDPPYANRSAWPIVSSTNPNNWDLYDMIGNVWEWCQDGTQPVICGGSCLAPPEYITGNSMYSKNLKIQYLGQQIKDKDVGFRVAVPAM